MEQDQFLEVVDLDLALSRFLGALDLRPLESEEVELVACLDRTLSHDLRAAAAVPPFDRSNVDGYAARAEDTFAASQDNPRLLIPDCEPILPGVPSRKEVRAGQAIAIATGGMVPRGSNAIVMLEDTRPRGGVIAVERPAFPGANITFAGSDISPGEAVLTKGQSLGSREIGILAAIGLAKALVVRRPRVAILSTGAELVTPGKSLELGQIYDSNGPMLALAVEEQGGVPHLLGTCADDGEKLREMIQSAFDQDVIVISGGTSKGPGDVSYRVLKDLGQPGILVHGVALKPGKPVCLAVYERPKARALPVFVLPGFPTSALFTFREFVAPVLSRYGDILQKPEAGAPARLASRLRSERGRSEYVLVHLVEAPDSTVPIALPIGKGSGSVSSFAQADGYLRIPRQVEYLEDSQEVQVHLLSSGGGRSALSVMGSHCIGLELVLARLRALGKASKTLFVGSQAGLEAAKRGYCDVAGMHLMDAASGIYNESLLTPELALIPGYTRMQGIMFRADDLRFSGKTIAEALHHACGDSSCLMVNRNRGSGTRILLDQLLSGRRPAGYLAETRSHHAVAAAIAQARADWGMGIEQVARESGLGFLPVQLEVYDFVVPRDRLAKPAVQALIQVLTEPDIVRQLRELGCNEAPPRNRRTSMDKTP